VKKPKLSPNAKQILKKRYLLKNEKGEIAETPEGLFKRVARTVSDVESNYPKSPYKVEELFILWKKYLML